MSEKNPSFTRIRQDYESIANRRPSGPSLTNRSSSMISIGFEEEKRKSFSENFEDDFKMELSRKLEKQRRSIDSYEEKPFVSPLVAQIKKYKLESEQHEKPPHHFDGRPPSYRVNIMEELKQKLNKNQVSSNYDVDRIVKETKTTTITQSKETIHFRKVAADDKKFLPSTTPSNGNVVSKCDPSTLNSQQYMMKNEEKKNSLNHIFPSHIEQWESPRSNTLIRRE
ncbi:unnamed protein product [Auanema sp. JU1783]|nr:unnamed protein product [Auanema sp. JU1783]